MKRRFTTRRLNSQPNSRDGGYILIGILFMVTIVIIGLAVAVPSLKTSIKREREEELIHRGHQYTRAIQLYYRKFGRYPASVEQLENTNNLRFLRQKYKDPITLTEEWKLIRFGQARTKPRPAYLKGATPAGNLGGTQGGIGATGTGTTTPGAGISNASDISKPLSGSSTLGGGPIVGVASTSEKEGLKEIDGKTKYNEWEFVYDPTLDRTGAAGAVPGAGAAGGVPGGVQGGTTGINPGMSTGPGIGDQRPTRPPR